MRMMMGQLLVVQLGLGVIAHICGPRCSEGWLEPSIGCVSPMDSVSRKGSFHTSIACHTALTHTWGQLALGIVP